MFSVLINHPLVLCHQEQSGQKGSPPEPPSLPGGPLVPTKHHLPRVCACEGFSGGKGNLQLVGLNQSEFNARGAGRELLSNATHVAVTWTTGTRRQEVPAVPADKKVVPQLLAG